MSITVIEELEALRESLRIEKREDFEQFKLKVQSLSLEKRRQQGYTWYPVHAVKTGYTIGEHAYIEVERTIIEDSSGGRLFRPGMMVNLFSNGLLEGQRESSGVIHYLNANKMKIILNARDIPDWVGGGDMGVDLLFDERTFIEMDKALSLVIRAKGNRLADLRDVLYGKQEARFSPELQLEEIPGLNASQQQAVQAILAAKDVAIVHGPPGTGKTTTLVKAIFLLSKREGTILVTAPSNTAADLLTERLAEEGLNVVRIGHLSRVDERLMQHTLEFKLAQHPESKNIKKVKVQAAECRRKAMRYKRHFGGEERRERQQLWEESRELSAWARQLEDRLLDQILSGAEVITSTLTGAAHPVIQQYKFGTVVIDEAAQALEPACWIPLLKAGKVVMAGDPFQLPPTVKSVEAKKAGLEKTLIEKCLSILPMISLLKVQYRMNSEIMAFSNKWFYDGVLKAHESVIAQRLAAYGSKSVTFVDTAGCGFEEELEPEYKSRFNSGEFNILREHLYQLVEGFVEGEFPSIGIISPYREQALYIKKNVEEDSLLNQFDTVVDTIDGFQGQEREVIYISLVRSNEKGEIGFLKDYRRMNVAMTRAKKLLVIIGDSGTIGNDVFYRQFLEHCDQNGYYQSAWEFMR